MKMKDYWFLAFVRCSNECVCERGYMCVCVFENQLGEQNDSDSASSPPPSSLHFPTPCTATHRCIFILCD